MAKWYGRVERTVYYTAEVEADTVEQAAYQLRGIMLQKITQRDPDDFDLTGTFTIADNKEHDSNEDGQYPYESEIRF